MNCHFKSLAGLKACQLSVNVFYVLYISVILFQQVLMVLLIWRMTQAFTSEDEEQVELKLYLFK